MDMFPSGNNNCLTKEMHLKEHTADMEIKHVNKNIYKYHTYNVKFTNEIRINRGKKKRNIARNIISTLSDYISSQWLLYSLLKQQMEGKRKKMSTHTHTHTHSHTPACTRATCGKFRTGNSTVAEFE